MMLAEKRHMHLNGCPARQFGPCKCYQIEVDTIVKEVTANFEADLRQILGAQRREMSLRDRLERANSIRARRLRA